jgi:membrane protein DedA with SNARE-associated domain
MALESVGIPFASMPANISTSVLITEGKFNIYWAILIGALGNATGSTISYLLGRFFGDVVRKFRKDHHVIKKEAKLQNYIKKYGAKTIFVAQLIGFARTFISFPAGMLKMNFKKFITATFFGGLIFTAWYVGLSFIIRDFYDQFVYPYIGLSFASLLIILGIGYIVTHFSIHIGKKAKEKYDEYKNGQDNGN